MSKPTSKRETVNILDDFGSDATIIASTSTPPKGMFSKEDNNAVFDNDDLEDEEEDKDPPAGASTLDNEEEEEEEDKDPPAGSGTSALDEDFEDDDDTQGGEGKKKGGRPTAIATALQKLIDRKIIQPFTDDQKPLSEYTAEDLEELIEVNIESAIAQTSQEAPLQVFNALSPEVKQVVAYSLQGGQDWKSVMKAAIDAKETLDLDVEKEQDQEKICREWLTVSGVMTPDEVEDEIATLKDAGQMKKKAEIFKPKLDQKQASVMEQKLKDQEAAVKREEEASKQYQASIYGILNNTALNGIPLDQKNQNALFYGLTDRRYTNSKGKPVNELSYLLEQYQFGEKPNHIMMAELLWLARDPQGYKQELIKMGEAQSTLKTRRDLRGAAGDGAGSTPAGTGTPSAAGVSRRRTQQQPPAAPQGGNGQKKSFFARD
jgi:hypothetical protein